MKRQDPSGIVLLVGGDLNAVARVEAACAAAGRELRRTTVERLGYALRESPALVLVDLDGAPEALPILAATEAISPERVVAYFSHVDTEAGERAAGAGLKALPRGRFWRELPDLIGRLS
jgi:hypothetical protein